MAFDEKPLKQFYAVCSGLAFLYGIALPTMWSFEVDAPAFLVEMVRMARLVLPGLAVMLFTGSCLSRAFSYGTDNDVAIGFVLSDIAKSWFFWALSVLPCALGFMLSAFFIFRNIPLSSNALAPWWIGPIALVMTFLFIPTIHFVCWGCSRLSSFKPFKK